MIKIASHCAGQPHLTAPHHRYDIMLLKLCSLTPSIKGISLTPVSNSRLGNVSQNPMEHADLKARGYLDYVAQNNFTFNFKLRQMFALPGVRHKKQYLLMYVAISEVGVRPQSLQLDPICMALLKHHLCYLCRDGISQWCQDCAMCIYTHTASPTGSKIQPVLMLCL